MREIYPDVHNENEISFALSHLIYPVLHSEVVRRTIPAKQFSEQFYLYNMFRALAME